MHSLILRHLRKVVILIFGGTILLLGIIFIVLPGPAIIMIPLGLGILAIEFAWAKKLLQKARQTAGNLFKKKH